MPTTPSTPDKLADAMAAPEWSITRALRLGVYDAAFSAEACESLGGPFLPWERLLASDENFLYDRGVDMTSARQWAAYVEGYMSEAKYRVEE